MDTQTMLLPSNAKTMLLPNELTIYHGSIAGIEYPSYAFHVNLVIILIITQGNAKLRINFEEHTVSSHDMLFSLPGNIFQVTEMSKNLNGYYIIVPENIILNLYLSTRQIPLYVYIHRNLNLHLDDLNFKIICSYYNLVIDVYSLPNYSNDSISQLISSCASHIQALLLQYTENLPKIQQKTTETLFYRFMNILMKYYRQERSVEFYADKLNITPKYLTTLLKRFSNKNASEWINNYVILEAKILLKYTDKSIQEIAFQLNFPSHTNFSKYFKNYTKETPGEFRRKEIENN